MVDQALPKCFASLLLHAGIVVRQNVAHELGLVNTWFELGMRMKPFAKRSAEK